MHRVRQRRADGDGADHDAHGQPASALKPAGQHLHSGRVNAGGGHAAEETQEQRQPDMPRRHRAKQGGECRSQQAGDGEDAGGAGQVEQVGGGQQECPGHETELHGEREPGSQAQSGVPFARELRDDRRAGEPKRLRQQSAMATAASALREANQDMGWLKHTGARKQQSAFSTTSPLPSKWMAAAQSTAPGGLLRSAAGGPLFGQGSLPDGSRAWNWQLTAGTLGYNLAIDAHSRRTTPEARFAAAPSLASAQPFQRHAAADVGGDAVAGDRLRARSLYRLCLRRRPQTDAYVAAFTLPDWLNYMVAGGTASITFISIFHPLPGGEARARGGEDLLGDHHRDDTVLCLGIALVEVFCPQLERLIFPDSPRPNSSFAFISPAFCCRRSSFFYVGGVVSAVLMSRRMFLDPGAGAGAVQRGDHRRRLPRGAAHGIASLAVGRWWAR